MRNQKAAHIDFFQFKGMIETNPKATPCDIDMIFERKCKFFVGEWKREGESISQGQGLLLRNLARQPQFTVVIISNTRKRIKSLVHPRWCATVHRRG